MIVHSLPDCKRTPSHRPYRQAVYFRIFEKQRVEETLHQKTPACPAGVFWVCVLCVCKGVGEGLVGVSDMLEVRSALPCFHVYITL